MGCSRSIQPQISYHLVDDDVSIFASQWWWHVCHFHRLFARIPSRLVSGHVILCKEWSLLRWAKDIQGGDELYYNLYYYFSILIVFFTGTIPKYTSTPSYVCLSTWIFRCSLPWFWTLTRWSSIITNMGSPKAICLNSSTNAKIRRKENLTDKWVALVAASMKLWPDTRPLSAAG